jgi:hypothetical protein
MPFGVGMFEDSSLMGIFTLPSPYPSKTEDPICIIYLVTNVSLIFPDPWVVPNPLEVKYYMAQMSFTMVDITSLVIQLTLDSIDKKLHLNMEYDESTPHT